MNNLYQLNNARAEVFSFTGHGEVTEYHVMLHVSDGSLPYREQLAAIDQAYTKLLREGEFQAAIPYLEKVPLSHISEQGISYYMARKDYNQEIWLKRQFLSPWKEHETEAKLTENAKLTYCRDMVALDKQIASATGEIRNQLLLKKANLLYQASFKGDCWYLTHYAQSANDEQQSNEYDFVNSARSLLREVELNTSDMDIKLNSVGADFGSFAEGEHGVFRVGAAVAAVCHYFHSDESPLNKSVDQVSSSEVYSDGYSKYYHTTGLKSRNGKNLTRDFTENRLITAC